MPSRPKTGRRNQVGTQHSIIVRYDFDARRWVHSAGIVVTPREATLLEALAKGLTIREMQIATCMDPATYFAAQTRLKTYFGLSRKRLEGHHQLLKIAMDLYGDNTDIRGRGRSSTQAAVTGNNGPGTAPSRVL